MLIPIGFFYVKLFVKATIPIIIVNSFIIPKLISFLKYFAKIKDLILCLIHR